MTTNARKPSVIIVHGAFHTASCFGDVKILLEEAGYTIDVPALPSVDADSVPATDFTPDVDAVRKSITTAADAENDIVLVCHSYGGVPGSEAAKGFAKHNRVKQGKQGGVISVIYITAFLCKVGESLLEARGQHADWLSIDDTGTYAEASNGAYHFYNDLHPEVAKKWAKELRKQSLNSLASKVTYEPWMDVPCTYVLCTIDNGTEPEIQQRMVDKVTVGHEVGVNMENSGMRLIRFRSGHSPFLSLPVDTANIIRRAAGERELVVRFLEE